MKAYHSPIDWSVPFDNVGTGFQSTNVHDAIIEAKDIAAGFSRAGLPLTMNGTVSNGSWITFTELLANPRILFALKTRITEITWNNNNVNLGAFDFVFYRDGQLVGNLIYTYSAPAGDRTAGYGYFTFPTNLDFNPGQSLYIKCVRPSGTALSDLALVLWTARIP